MCVEICPPVWPPRLTKDSLVGEVFHDNPDPSWKDANQNVQVEEEGGPGGGLVLRHTGNDGDVDLGIAVGETTILLTVLLLQWPTDH